MKEIIEIIAKGLREAFNMGLKQSPFDAENSEFYMPLLELTKAPKLAKDIETLINQEVERRIKERMPSKEERKEWLNSFDFGNVEHYNYGRAGAIAGIEWLRFRLTSSEKPNNSTGGK